MLFNSIEFLLFLPITFMIYWFIGNRNLKAQNLLLIVASYVFYGWWDFRFLALIAISTTVDYFVGLALEKEEIAKKRKILVGLSLMVNLGMLGFFKYFNFFVSSWIDAWSSLGVEMHESTLNIILPVGISFYTFQTLSYTFDVYRKKIPATHSFINFATFVAFFPQLVAGPIERASKLLTQVSQKRSFNSERAISGMNLILWGLFKKVVIADSCATYVNTIFDNYQEANTLTLVLGVVYFGFQIYGDFSGYSDIAIGTARLFGFELTTNFNYPYFSRNIAEFWRKWHITLFSWFRDYVYIPLGGSRIGKAKEVRNVLLVFLVSGVWHGANWNFIVWSLLHGLYFIPLLIRKSKTFDLNQVSDNRLAPSINEFFQMLKTFILVTLAWVFFRAENITEAIDYYKRMFFNLNFNIELLLIERYSVEILVLLFFFLAIEWYHRNLEHPFVGKFKWVKITGIILMILTLGAFSDNQQFIYFQF